MDTAATIFSGGGGADIGLSDAGLSVQWGIEYDDDIATVGRENGLDIRTGDVTEEDPSDYEPVDVLHASPPCPNFSVAKTGAEETDEDVSLARATVKFIRRIEPTLFTLENVWGYRKSQSWKLIREHLQRSGYDWNAWKLNAANYGVPQTRKRMIVAARKGGPRPKKPTPTHVEEPQNGGLFGDEKDQWIGWYEAIEDLIDELPETELADWQKERLPDEIIETVVCDSEPNSRGDCRIAPLPTKTVAADPSGGVPRAVLVHGSDTRGCPQQEYDEPSFSVIANGNQKGAGANVPRAVLVDGQQDNLRNGDDPTYSVPATIHKGTGRAILLPDGNASGWSTQQQNNPSFSIAASSYKRNHSAMLSRRVVQMTPRCLARFQTFPDWYDLPDTKSLACRIIGNAVPPLLMKKCVEAWM